MLLPVVGNPPGRTGSWLVERMVPRRRHRGSLTRLVGPIVIEPIFARFKAANDPMFFRLGVSRRMLAGRRVTAPDVATGGTTPKVEPPALNFCALETAITTWGNTRVNQRVSHTGVTPWGGEMDVLAFDAMLTRHYVLKS